MSIDAIAEEVERQSEIVSTIVDEVAQIIVGQERMVERVLVGLLAGGHVLLEGVPGLAKTLTIKTIAQAIRATFKRIQFTPDLLPADIIGTVIYNHQKGEFTAKRGPLFAHLILADEINRAPAKVQSALLEAMQERQVTIGEETFVLPEPFMVMATQNPIEQEGTYALPEAQLDRFMLMIRVPYPSKVEERQIMDRMATGEELTVDAVAGPEEILAARKVICTIYVDERVRDYIVELIHATRDPAAHNLGSLAELIEYGASPRATLSLLLGAQTHAFIHRRAFVTPEDVKAIAPDVLRHRIILTYEAEAEEIDSEEIIKRLFEKVHVP